MTALELLQQARSKIERGWTKGWFARDENDMRVDIGSGLACKFCLSGALYVEVGDNSWVSARRHILDNLRGPHQNFVSFNDDPYTTKEDVLNLLDRAIESAKTEV
jgi:hypothetical protein